jgi:cytochrome d ubiquinol oxidase subunit II
LIGIKGALVLVALAGTLLSIPDAAGKPLAWIFTLLVFVSLFLLRNAVHTAKDLHAFVFSSLSFGGLWGIAGSIHYPNLVKAVPDASLSITIYNASSSALTLKVMLIIALIGMPLVIGYTIFLYKVFKGKVTLNTKGYV